MSARRRMPAAQDPPSAARTAAPAPAPPAADAVLALQRSAGNAAVARVLARETDPRLTYNEKAKAEGAGLDARTLPYKDPPESGWSSGEILGALTQVDESGDTFSDEVRCGANAVLAVAITRGPARVTETAEAALKSLDAPRPASKAKPDDVSAARKGLAAAITALKANTATYGDLSRLAHAMKVALADDPRGATTGHEVVAMAGLVGPAKAGGTPVQDPLHVFQLADGLKVGEAMILNVDTDVPDPKQVMRSNRDLNHFVTVGKKAAARDAAKSKVYDRPRDWMLWMYDPYPRVGSQVMLETDAGFFYVLEDARGKPKSVQQVAVIQKGAPREAAGGG